jgi:hypothetical protein
MFRFYRNGWPPFIRLRADSGGGFSHAPSDAFGKLQCKNMNNQGNHTSRKGGRPKKVVKRDQLLAVKCTLLERTAIEYKAKSVGLTKSEYLRTMAMTGKIDRLTKVLPKEVLQLSGTLNHLAANMNQVAKKLNSNEFLTSLDRAGLEVDALTIKKLAQDIKTYLQ